ncbi:MAG: PAS domain-containing sensor histidine kinase [Gemmatimonadota bacterium]|jgi:PAS domain S-box-containing protein
MSPRSTGVKGRKVRSVEKRRRGFDPSQPGRGAAWATGFALLFLFLSLLALVLLPSRWEEDVQDLRDQVREVLDPAERLTAKIQFSQAREMEAFFSFLLLGDADSRLRYREAMEAEEAALDTLSTLTEEMSIGVREEMANLVPLSFSWHLGHQEMLSRELTADPLPPSGEVSAERLRTERAAYTEVLAAGEDLMDALAVERVANERALARARFLQAQYAQILVILGLGATVVVLVLAWRLRVLMRESEARRQAALRARREADGLLRATGDGVLGMDMDGKCTFLNRAGAELLGYSARAVVGRSVHEMLHHSRPDGTPFPREDCAIITSLREGKPISGRNETLWRAGREPFPVQVSLRAMKDGIDIRGAVLSFTDMTETRAAEDSLRQAVQARDEVLAVVSHDLRNPVGTIFSAASLLLTLDPPPEKRREHLLAIKRSAKRMNRLIQDLLDVARLEAGVMPVHPASFDPGSVLEELVAGHQQNAEVKGLNLEVRVPPGLPRAWGDRHRVIQALTNLLENAVRETPEGGLVAVGVVEMGAGDGLSFFVMDTGPGIPPEAQKRLFDRFWQVSRKKKGGAGLGLSIVKGIVEAHGGEVWLESREGGGSTFWFSLPGKKNGEEETEA